MDCWFEGSAVAVPLGRRSEYWEINGRQVDSR